MSSSVVAAPTVAVVAGVIKAAVVVAFFFAGAALFARSAFAAVINESSRNVRGRKAYGDNDSSRTTASTLANLLHISDRSNSGTDRLRFFFGGASFFDATTADATSATGNTAANSLVIHQGKECDDKEEDE